VQLSNGKEVEIGYDSSFLDSWFRYQKLAWAVVVAVLVAGLAGLLGRGPVATGEVSSGELTVKYERIARYKTPARIEISVASLPLSECRNLRIRLEGEFTQRALLQHFSPTPLRSEPLANGIVIEYSPTTDATRKRITLTEEPGVPGRLTNRVTVEQGPSVEFTQLVLP
jgi:hypothetical protein